MNSDHQDRMALENQNCVPENAYCQIKLDSLLKLKDSTRKLLCLLEDLQSKTHTSKDIPDDTPKLTRLLQDLPTKSLNHEVSDTYILTADAMRHLENQTNNLDEIYIQGEDDDCSIFKRLTRKCHCLNHRQYNDFIIHFNENTKFFTSTRGEVIKNIRILKKFLYMGGAYTRNALSFLNEGLSESCYNEKVEIIQACSHADVCNVFDEHTIVATCITWPCKSFKYEHFGDSVTQELAAELLHKLAQTEEGRRYLNFSSKITNDIKKVVRKESSKLEPNTLESLNSTLNLLNPTLTRHINVTYYCKAEQGMGYRTFQALSRYRAYMSLDETVTHLELLNNLSVRYAGKLELRQHLPNLLSLFKRLIMENDNIEVNTNIINILNNLVSNTIKNNGESLKTFAVTDMATEPIKLKNVINQVPSKKNAAKKVNKCKIGFGVSPNKFRGVSKQNVGEGSTRHVNKFNKN